MDKLDANISGIPTIIQNVQSSLDNIETTIGDKLKDSSDKQAVFLSAFEKKLETIAKKQQTNTYITWVIIIIAAITVILLKKC